MSAGAHSFSFEAFDHGGLCTYLHTAKEDVVEDAVYLRLIWRLTDGLRRYGIPRYFRTAGAVGEEPYALVDWEYEVEVEPEREPKPDAIRAFVPARSSVRGSPPPGPYEVANAKKAGLFELRAFRQLSDVMTGLQNDASAELNLFALAEGPGRLLSALSQSKRPRLADVLEPMDVFVDLVIGVDMGYSNVLLIQSHSDLSAKLDPLVADHNAGIEESTEDA